VIERAKATTLNPPTSLSHREGQMSLQESFTLRIATVDDLTAINDIYNHYVLNCTCTWKTEPDTMAQRKAWFAAHDQKHPVIVAEVDSRIIGWASLSEYRPNPAYHLTVEDSVYLRHDMLGRGIGSALLAELIHRGKAIGYHSILARISGDRATSIKLHKKFGFQIAGRLKEVGGKFNQVFDLVYMQLML
jgi:phosphinothricin acetyltransferase